MDDNKGSGNIDRLLSNNDGKISNRAMIEKRRPNITPFNLAEELNDINYKYFKIQLFHKLLIQFLNNWRGAERNNEQGEKVLKSVRRECVYTHICIKKMRARGGISGACLEETQQVGFIG